MEYVYAATNQYIPNLIKIGRTKLTPLERMKDMSATAGVPGKQKLLCSAPVRNGKDAEDTQHQIFDPYHEVGEFYDISPKLVVKLFGMFENANPDPKPVRVSPSKSESAALCNPSDGIDFDSHTLAAEDGLLVGTVDFDNAPPL